MVPRLRRNIFERRQESWSGRRDMGQMVSSPTRSRQRPPIVTHRLMSKLSRSQRLFPFLASLVLAPSPPREQTRCSRSHRACSRLAMSLIGMRRRPANLHRSLRLLVSVPFPLELLGAQPLRIWRRRRRLCHRPRRRRRASSSVPPARRRRLASRASRAMASCLLPLRRGRPGSSMAPGLRRPRRGRHGCCHPRLHMRLRAVLRLAHRVRWRPMNQSLWLPATRATTTPTLRVTPQREATAARAM
mmetsp:Transcript_9727/g.27214  ORF Transcript_9727/g.27214 Transcript_9727/m.27214 type:complete len:245 (-) Transcript_9727:36-770(-)